MQISLFTDAFPDRPLGDVLGWCAAVGIEGVELGVGGYSPSPHADLGRLSRDREEQRQLARAIGEAGLELSALNVSGNPLHPDSQIADAHDRALRQAVEVAAHLGVTHVVAMSGCPGGPGSGAWPVFAGGAWLPDMEGLWEWQWERIAAYWSALSRWAADVAPDVVICLELHPGTSIYNPASFSALRSVTEGNVRVNLDPSHLWWQQMEPLEIIAMLGPDLAYAHGKDLRLQPALLARHGVLDFRWPSAYESTPWHFAAVGTAHGLDEWRSILAALAGHGVDVVSIEHEDPRVDAETGIETSLNALRSAIRPRPTVRTGRRSRSGP